MALDVNLKEVLVDSPMIFARTISWYHFNVKTRRPWPVHISAATDALFLFHLQDTFDQYGYTAGGLWLFCAFCTSHSRFSLPSGLTVTSTLLGRLSERNTGECDGCVHIQVQFHFRNSRLALLRGEAARKSQAMLSCGVTDGRQGYLGCGHSHLSLTCLNITSGTRMVWPTLFQPAPPGVQMFVWVSHRRPSQLEKGGAAGVDLAFAVGEGQAAGKESERRERKVG